MTSHKGLFSEPQIRMASFISQGRNTALAMYGINFTNDLWQLPADRIGGTGNKRLNFTAFSGSFKDLLKAIAANACATNDGRGLLTRSGFISAALHLAPSMNALSDLSGIGIHHFHQAVQSIRERTPEYATTTKYSLGSTLAIMAKELDAHRLTSSRIGFNNPFPHGGSYYGCDEETVSGKRSKMPEVGALTALGEIYHEIMSGQNNDQDRLVVSAVTLLFCTGFRIHELLALPLNCWHEGQTRDEEGRIVPACFLGYTPEKAGTDNAMNRWIAPSLVGLAKNALDEITRITEPFRENARIRFNGGINLSGLDDNRIYNMAEAARILGYSDAGLYKITSVRAKKTTNGDYRISAQFIRNLAISYCFKEPVQTFPWRQELHESLFVVGHRYFNTHAGMTGTACILTSNVITNFLSGCREWKSTSCFARFNKFNPETGKPWRIQSHGFRHMLNTMFQLGGFTQDDIASYFGRVDARANENYNHMTRRQRLAVATAAYECGELVGPLREALDSIKDPVRRSLAMAASFGNTQLSPLGICFHHDGAEVPSIPDRCAVCPGLGIIKGHPALIEETKRQLEVAERTYNTLQDGLSKGYIQDGPWVPLAMERRDRLRTMLGIHMDNSTPNGRVIQLGNPKRKREQCTPRNV